MKVNLNRLLGTLFLTVSPFLLSKQILAKDKSLPFQVTTASNGLQIIAVPMAKVPLVTIVLVFKAGAMTELPETNGLTHLWEHMFFKGNKRLPDQEAFNKRIRQLGITFNGDTSAEMVRYYFTLPSKNLEAGLQFMADAISTPLLEQTELERERKVVLDEYDRNASQPGFELSNIERMVIYGPQEFLRNPLGRRRLVEKASRDQLRQIAQEVFVPANGAIIISGDVDPRTIKTLVDKNFDGWKTPDSWKPVDRGSFPAFPKKTDIVKTHALAQNVSQQITWKGPRVLVEKEDTWAIDVLIQLLEHRSGNFFKKYIDSGMTLSSGFSYHTQGRAGELVLFAMSSPENAAKAKAALLKEPLEWAKPGYFTNAQLDDVRRRLTIGYKMELNKPSAYGKTLAFWWATAGLNYYEGYLDHMQKVSLKDVQEIVKKYLIDKPYVAVALLSPKDAEIAKYTDNSAAYVEQFLKNY